MNKTKTFIASVLAAVCFHAAHACTPSRNFDVYFSLNSSTIPASEMLRLANWMVDQRISFPAQAAISVGGYAEEREHQPKALASLRLQEIKRILIDRKFNQEPLQEQSGVYRSGDVSNGKRVEISLLPACRKK